ncbi:MAG: hypothetical protein ABJA78_09850 [Ferruginibacter sp.]
MKKQLNQITQFTFLSVIFLLSFCSFTFSQKIGQRFGTRDPRTCAGTQKPLKGAITAELGKQYLICQLENASHDYLNLVENVQVQIGAGVTYNARNFPSIIDIDPKSPVYPFRASFNQYVCDPISTMVNNKGKNCDMTVRSKATGVFVKTTFGDWNCYLTGSDIINAPKTYSVAPPVSQ